MNSYGSVSRVSESIYKLLRYMNWVASDDDKGDKGDNGDNGDNGDKGDPINGPPLH